MTTSGHNSAHATTAKLCQFCDLIRLKIGEQEFLQNVTYMLIIPV